ncbi:cell division protein DedD [mine drainage metagenome]|uniref:Cell division protein DedD n=1 Tax=mine drainage metagenome TaxID=410659 RepID=A0A1J5QS05_9ZZZZ
MKLPGKRGKEGARRAGSAEPQSEEALRVRARRRLIGAVALVLTGVIVFPLIFETQPRPVSSNMTLEIPPQPPLRAVASAAAPATPAPASASTALPTAPSTGASTGTSTGASTGASSAAATAPAQAARPVVAVKPQPVNAPVAPRAPAPTAAAQGATAPPAAAPDAQRVAGARQALAALEGKTPQQISAQTAAEAAVPQGVRYVVQAGAYADAATARKVRAKIEQAGFKTYTQVVDTAGGKRIRVRVGPFNDHGQAAHAATRIKALGFSAVVLTL